MITLAVAGAGAMARVVTRAFLATGRVSVGGVASRTLSSAEKFGSEVGCDQCFDDYRGLIDVSPDAVLVELPHAAQDEVVLWALDRGLHVLIGGCLATSSAVGERIGRIARDEGLVVEAGYQSRYSEIWETTKSLVDGGRLGRVAAVRSLALWPADPQQWYYQQHASGGMPLTHMTYCYLNPIRWVFGDPVAVSAFSNRIARTAPGMIEQETCTANLLLPNGVVCDMTASYLQPGNVRGLSVMILGTEGIIEMYPEESRAVIYRGDEVQEKDFSSSPDPFQRQAEAFIQSIGARNECHNTPEDAIVDVRVAEAIATSARELRTIGM